MSEKQDKKLPIKIRTLSKKTQGEDFGQPCKADITKESKAEKQDFNQRCQSEINHETRKPSKTTITTEISTNSKIVGEIPPWDDDEDSQRGVVSKPPTITAEIIFEEEKLNTIPKITGEIPPWDDEEEIKR